MSDKKKNILKIIKHYGYENQIWKLIEELGELISAIARFHQRGNSKKAVSCYDNVLEEMADVEVVSSGIKYFFKADSEVEEIKQKKIDRQLERMKDNVEC